MGLLGMDAFDAAKQQSPRMSESYNIPADLHRAGYGIANGPLHFQLVSLCPRGGHQEQVRGGGLERFVKALSVQSSQASESRPVSPVLARIAAHVGGIRRMTTKREEKRRTSSGRQI
jgi:hypothetical protein